MDGVNDNGEDYLTECMKNKCIETADYHALQCQCEGPMKSITMPANCNEMMDPRDTPTANLNAFGLPASNGAVVGHMAFALISPRQEDNYTANWTILGTGVTVQAKPGTMSFPNLKTFTSEPWKSMEHVFCQNFRVQFLDRCITGNVTRIGYDSQYVFI